MTIIPAFPLGRVLEKTRCESVEFPYLLANHAPMVLVALDRMGASPERLDEWYEIYRVANQLVPAPPAVAPIERARWDAALGDRTRESDYRAYFIAEVERLGTDAAIRHYLPRLIQGVAGSALHPLMRLAYAVPNSDTKEVGTALGYWATCYLPLPGPTGIEPDTDDPAAILAAMNDVAGAHDYVPETDLLWHNIREVAALPDFPPVIDRLRIDEATPKRMAETALALFASTMDFSALHAVTGLHWARLVAPHLDDPLPLYRAFWQVIATLVPKIGFPALPTAEALQAMREMRVPDWPEIRATAVASNDEHDISLVFSALQEQLVWGDPLYRVVAARRVRLI
ncbi:questin oxidase family protein (plasmid) [Rhizobium sp. WW22]|uniref:questin oxidase family protein n=1 Tax=Rhizobium sp. WW22 TaxID=3389070 RepID=UPI000DD90203